MQLGFCVKAIRLDGFLLLWLLSIKTLKSQYYQLNSIYYKISN